MKSDPAHHNRRSGFTLIEILVVISLLGVFVVGTLTSFNSAKNNQDLTLSAEHITDTLRRAHIFSRDSKEEKTWGVKADATSYQFVARNDEHVVTNTISTTLPTGIQITTPAEVWFDKGTGNAPGFSSILLKNRQNQQIRIDVETTGVVTQNVL